MRQAVPVDRTRYPSYGGRRRPDECSFCHRILACYVVDGPGEEGHEPICPVCLQAGVQAAIDAAELDRKTQPPARRPAYVYDDEQCPQRGPGLNHTQNGAPRCVFCGAVTYHRQKS